MIARVIVDTGPLVAFLNRRDQWHAWVLERMAEIRPPLLSCESVMSESSFLLRSVPGGPAALLELIHRDVVRLPFSLADEAKAVDRLIQRYRSVPMSMADACLVRMAERLEPCSVFTLDADLRVYRKHGRRAIPLIFPDRR